MTARRSKTSESRDDKPTGIIELAQAVGQYLQDSRSIGGMALIDIRPDRLDVAIDTSVIAGSHTMQPLSILDRRRQSKDSVSIEAESQEQLDVASRMAIMFRARRSVRRLPVRCLGHAFVCSCHRWTRSSSLRPSITKDQRGISTYCRELSSGR